MPIHFAKIDIPAPTFEELAGQYLQLNEAYDGATSTAGRLAAIGRWDEVRRRLGTWDALVGLRFNQDTRNTEHKRAREYCDQLRPKVTDLDVNFKRKLLRGPHKEELAKAFGPQIVALWEADILTFEPAIEQDLVKESKLESEYVELTAGAKLDFQNEKLNLSEIVKFAESPERPIRLGSNMVRWQWFANNRESLDRIYDEQVKLRDGMAQKLGMRDFIELGYKRMKRVDYNRDDVERFRAEVRQHLVPLAAKIRQRQAEKLLLPKLMYWDQAIHDPTGNPRPKGDHDWMVARAAEMFAEMGHGLDEFYRLMVDSDLMDLKNREGKAGGGFCTSFPSFGVPYIFANFNGTKGDVEVFTHEAGHAFQCYESRKQPLSDYLWPTYESCEIHSMSLEFLTIPYMDKFFGEDAARFAEVHLTQSLLFIPYGVAVDHYQHLVYSQPNATPAQRRAMWQEMERTYLPWLDYGELPHVADGGFWQSQRHIYLNPFYYIDYTLAQTCALQFWVRSKRDFSGAMRDYVALCKRGGEAPFQELTRSAGLISPFDAGCLKEVVQQAAVALGMR